MSHRIAVADTCFLIDWARYRRRDLLFQVFEKVVVPEDVISEVRSENTIEWISQAMAEDKLVLYTPIRDEQLEAARLVEESIMNPRMPRVDLPEALCLVIGRRHGYIVLSENRGALLTPLLIGDYREVKVWRSLEVLVEAIKTRVIRPPCREPDLFFREYSHDTLHIFPRKSLEEAVREAEKHCIG